MSDNNVNEFTLHERKLPHASLFTGLGAWDLAARWLGWYNLFQCEINHLCSVTNPLYERYDQSMAKITAENTKKVRGNRIKIPNAFVEPCGDGVFCQLRNAPAFYASETRIKIL